MAVSFLGLLGTNGPLPLTLTEYAYNRRHNEGDETLARFLDLFNHRMISLFYRAWALNQLPVSCDRAQDDWLGQYLASLFGMGTEAFHRRDAIPDHVRRYYAGRLSWQGKNAEGLCAILQEDMETCVTIHEFVGHWVELPPHQRCRLGVSRGSAELGRTSVAGSRFWECQQKFRIRLGPVGFDFYRRLLPGGEALARLTAWVRGYVGDELGWELQVVLQQQEVPRTCLGKMGQLGLYSWLCSGPLGRDADDLVLQPRVA
jgi:type VI secretion system protein ImpH